MTKLNQQEIDERLGNLHHDWVQDGDSIKRDFVFENFVLAFGFMTTVAIEADNADHHPDWQNVYNKVSISLSTHEAGGLTEQDFSLATKIDGLYNN
jgi:4a-hydroxytetrahydrobiopterin dehydratase